MNATPSYAHARARFVVMRLAAEVADTFAFWLFRASVRAERLATRWARAR